MAEHSAKAKEAYRTISEVADDLGVPQHVLRFWETKFTMVKPLKRAGGRRYYRPQDIELLRHIQRLLRDEGYTIKGVQKVLKSARGVASAIERAQETGVIATAGQLPGGVADQPDASTSVDREMTGAGQIAPAADNAVLGRELRLALQELKSLRADIDRLIETL